MATTAAEFEAAILADPDDPAPYLVYADWLQGQGDPRGELIVLQHKEANDAIAAHFAAHPALLGPFGTFAAAEPAKHKWSRGKELKLAWRWGFIDTIDISWGMYDRGGTSESAAAEMRELLVHPSARFVRRLAVGPTPGDDGMYMRGVDAAVAEHAPASVRELVWGRAGEWDISSTGTGALGAILTRLAPGLRKVRASGGDIELAPALVLPELRELSIETGALSAEALDRVIEARWPKLASLDLWIGQTNYGGSTTTAQVGKLLARTDMPALRHLAIKNCPYIDDVIPLLARSKLLAQLTSLDLSMGALSDEGLRRMVEHQDAFRHLTSIDIDDNALSEEVESLCATFTPELVMGEQDPDRADPDTAIEDRWTSVGE